MKPKASDSRLIGVTRSRSRKPESSLSRRVKPSNPEPNSAFMIKSPGAKN